MRRSNVDLPEPFAPRSRQRDPLGNDRLSCCNVGASVLGSYEKLRSVMEMAFDSSYGGMEGNAFAFAAVAVAVVVAEAVDVKVVIVLQIECVSKHSMPTSHSL